MDGLVPSSQPGRDEIEAAARAMGVIPGDGAYPFVQWMIAERDDLKAEIAAHRAKLDQVKAVFTDDQLDELARRLAASFGAWAGHVRRSLDRATVAIHLGSVAAALIVGLGVGWWVFSPPSGYACDTQRGGYVCFVWLKPATQPPPNVH
jgi:hypothetical protein